MKGSYAGKDANKLDVEERPEFTFPDGNKYRGEWLKGEDVRHGRGVNVWTDGARYEG